MRLFQFFECLDLNIPVLIVDENGVIIDENIVGEITQKTMNQREVLKAYHEADKIIVTTCRSKFAEDVMQEEEEEEEDEESAPEMNKIPRSYEVIIVLRDDLSDDERSFVLKQMDASMKKLNITQDGNVFYREPKRWCEDLGPGVSFLMKMKNFKNYFKILEYNSYIEGIMHGKLD